MPVLVVGCLALFFGITTFQTDNSTEPSRLANVGQGLDDSYLTVQPTNNPNMTVTSSKNWSLNDMLARTERIRQISRRVAPNPAFDIGAADRLTALATARNARPAPYARSYFRMRPIIRVFVAPSGTTRQEDDNKY